ncbi:MAG: copper resistance protein CopC [Gemmatimonadaceae bacterium]
MKLHSVLVILISIGLVASPRAAFAHARLVKSAPAAGAAINLSPKLIQLWFSEAPEARLTVISVTSADGRIIRLEQTAAVPDTAVSVRSIIDGVLAPGVYTVAWRTVAADDGHPSKGSFSFTVDGEVAVAGAPMTAPPAQTGAATGAATGAVTGAAIGAASTAVPTATTGIGVESPIYVVVRWLSFIGLVVVIGAIAFRLLVVPRIGAAAPEAFAAILIPRLATLGLIAGGVVAIAAILRLFAEQSVMAASVKLGVADIVLHTAWGSAWLLQVGAAIVACAGLVLARRRSVVGWSVATAAVIILGITPALSGHAASVAHWRMLAIATDSLHVIAAGAWLGSLCALMAVGLPTVVRFKQTGSTTGVTSRLISDMVNAFSPVALTFATGVVVTGLVSAWLRLGSISALWTSSYGIVLIVKLALVGAVFAAGAFNALRMRAALSHAATAGSFPGEHAADSALSSAGRRFQRSGQIELLFGALVIAVTAVLVAIPTPLH